MQAPTLAELQALLQILPTLPDGEKRKVYQQLEAYERLQEQEKARKNFMEFVKKVWPTFIGGRHHSRMARAFERVARGELKRLIINMPPRHTKSEFASYLLPAWFLGNYPHKKVIQTSHTAELAVGFGRKVRNLVDQESYTSVFPGVGLQADSKAAGRWATNAGGEYFAIGVGGAVTGKGADLLIIDDPHALEVNTPIATPNGFVAIKDLSVGDYVYGPDGEPTKVVSKSDVYKNRELYEVKTFDGEVIYADAKHIWNVRTSTRTKDPYRNLRTEDLVEARSSPFMIPKHSAVQYPVRDLPVDPWVLGAWLGDGTSSLGRMTAHPDDAVFMRGEFHRRGYQTTDLADKFSFGVPKLRKQLLDLGVLNSKHIPEAYMTASYLQRMDLLCGLMDTGGNVTDSGQCVFHNKDAALVDQVVELLHSLGRKCKRRSYQTNGSNYGDCLMHRVTFKLKDCALMPRKRYRTKTTHDKQHRSIAVRKTEMLGDVQCITVERSDGLFLAGRGYVVTHNSEQEAALAETNPDIYDKTYEWYTSGPRQRLQPGGAIVIVMCMTGDTPVLMGDGTEKSLKDIRPGDVVATFEGGKLTTSQINNWQSSGVDSIYRIQTQSGRILRANERHPFLVMNEGVLEWTRLKHLQPGDLLVSLKDATDPHGLKQNPENADRVKPKTHTTVKTQTHRTTRLGITGSGKTERVLSLVATPQSTATGYAQRTIVKIIGLLAGVGNHQKNVGPTALKAGTGLRLSNMMQWFKSAITSVMSAVNPLRNTILAPIGMGSSASTTATTQEKSEAYSVMTAISQLVMERQQMFSNELRRISDFTTDPIVSITPDGSEEVFDVEVDRTENFIANGVVSHNTRWAKRDLTGQVIKAEAQRGGEGWEVIEFPALLPSGQPLWPEFWSLKELEALKNELPNSKWQAQYQQNPVSESSAIVKREWWQIWENEDPPHCDFVLQAWDTAFEKSNRADYSACTTWGVFYQEDDAGIMQANIIMLNAFRDRMEFPELKRRTLEQMKDWDPDSVIIEKKASGAPLIYELRSMGVPVQEFTPSKGNDKISRLNAVSDLFASGRVWAPNTQWAEEVIDEVASFPAGDHDDYVDSVSLALMRFRKGGYIRSALDEEDELPQFRRQKQYY